MNKNKELFVCGLMYKHIPIKYVVLVGGAKFFRTRAPKHFVQYLQFQSIWICFCFLMDMNNNENFYIPPPSIELPVKCHYVQSRSVFFCDHHQASKL